MPGEKGKQALCCALPALPSVLCPGGSGSSLQTCMSKQERFYFAPFKLSLFGFVYVGDCRIHELCQVSDFLVQILLNHVHPILLPPPCPWEAGKCWNALRVHHFRKKALLWLREWAVWFAQTFHPKNSDLRFYFYHLHVLGIFLIALSKCRPKGF